MVAFSWMRESQTKERETGISSRVKCHLCSDEDKERMGCKGGVDWTVGGITINKCPENYITDETMMSVEIWSDWKTFGFPFVGHWSEQPHYVIDSIRIIEEIMRNK